MVKVEDTDQAPGPHPLPERVEIRAAATPGLSVRRAGEDVAAGDPVMIRWAVPSTRGRGAAPAGTSPLTGSTTGVSGQAPVVSFARTA